MKCTFKLNGVSVVKDIPTRWEEVSWSQFIAISKAGDDRGKVLSILSGIDYDTLKTAQISNFTALMQLISWVWATKLDPLLPSKITILGTNHEYPVANNLELTEYDRYMDLDRIVRSMTDENVLDHFPLICATYAVNPYKWEDAEALAKEFHNAPCTEVMAIGNFTQVNILGLRNIIPTIALRGDTRLNRWRRAMRHWAEYLAVTLRYYSLRKTLPTSVKKFIDGR